MKRDTKCKLLIHPEIDELGEYQKITAEEAGWKVLNFGAKVLKKGDSWKGNTGNDEMCIFLLGGNFSISSKW